MGLVKYRYVRGILPTVVVVFMSMMPLQEAAGARMVQGVHQPDGEGEGYQRVRERLWHPLRNTGGHAEHVSLLWVGMATCGWTCSR